MTKRSILSMGTLAITIHLLNFELANLGSESKKARGKRKADLQELELSYWKALLELKRAYKAGLKEAANFPPYEELFGEEIGA